MKITREQARAAGCPNCTSGPGQWCTQPTDNGRRAVPWVHLARESEYLDRREAAASLTGS
jgi:hypothetical protein